MWLTKLKIAIIEKDTDSLKLLMDNLPSLENQKEIDEALHLIAEAKSLVVGLRDETQAAMVQMKKNITFLKSTEVPLVGKFDIIS